MNPLVDPVDHADGGDEPEGEGAEILDALHGALTTYVVFPSPEAADAATLWDAASYAQPAWEHAPRLVLVSPEKRCGKSRAQDVIAETCHRPLITVNATVAAVTRSLSADPPTLLVDEADTIFGTKKQADNNEDLRGILNAGHQRNRPMIRWDITTRSLDNLATFAFACLASIGDLPDTIMDRAVVIRMRRRAPGEHVQPFRTRRDAPPLNDLRDLLAGWVRDHLAELEKAVPDFPLEDREADTWEPLIAVADLAGGGWPKRARAAAAALVKAERGADPSLGVRLLTDLKTVFGEAEKLATSAVLDHLHKIDEAPWADLEYGKALDARGLANRLRPYGVRPKVVRIGEQTPRGYEKADLRDAWTRYLPATPATDQTSATSAGQGVAHAERPPATPRPAVVADVAPVAGVADPPSQDGHLLDPAGQLSIKESIAPVDGKHPEAMTPTTLVPAEELRTCTVRQALGDGRWGEPETITDLRGTPIGDHAEVWTGDRLVYPRHASRRRVRQKVTISYCAEGWHSTSGSSQNPRGPELCHTLLDPRWARPGGGLDRDRFHAFHDQHPVVWIVRLLQGSSVSRLPYCDPELPDEYRELWP